MYIKLPTVQFVFVAHTLVPSCYLRIDAMVIFYIYPGRGRELCEHAVRTLSQDNLIELTDSGCRKWQLHPRSHAIIIILVLFIVAAYFLFVCKPLLSFF